jgi:hypothetical protein
LVLVLLLAIGAGGTAFAKTINVPGQYATIGAAITAAQDGDLVVVGKGTYTEAIDFGGKAITVRSTFPHQPQVVAATIITSYAGYADVTFRSGETARSVLSGFTITKSNYPAGVYIDGSSPTVTYNVISGNSANNAGGVYCNGGSPYLAYNTISGNSSARGGGVGCEDGSTATLTNNIITGNTASLGGGVDCFGGASPTLTNNTITGNSATSDGGGVLCESGCSPTLTNNIINGNSASSEAGGGVMCDGTSASPKLTNNTISGNSAHWGGGVLCRNSAAPTLTNDTISGNSATYGGGVWCEASAAPTLTNDTISGNSAPGGGGGVYCYTSSPTLTNDTISGNSAPDGGGGVYCADASPIIKNTIIAFSTNGGGLEADSTSKPVLTYCDAYDNTGGNYVGLLHSPTGKNGDISKNPLFYNATKGNFYLMSKYGRWAPALKTWATDTVTSPCLDAGDPTSAFNLEPAPNGGRINMGADGDTIYASKSATTGTSSAAALTVSAASAQGLAGGRQQLVFVLSAPASVQAEIVNIAGRVIRELPAGDTAQAGVNTLSWDGLSAAGTAVPNGVYLVRLVARTPDGAQAQALVTCTVRR